MENTLRKGDLNLALQDQVVSYIHLLCSSFTAIQEPCLWQFIGELTFLGENAKETLPVLIAVSDLGNSFPLVSMCVDFTFF